jgi:hypothetical protein
VFHTNPPLYDHDISIVYIEEILECTNNLKETDKDDLFESQGIDYEKVKKYYETVKLLNKIYYGEIQNGKENKCIVTDAIYMVLALLFL